MKWLVMVNLGGIAGPAVYVSDTAPTLSNQFRDVLTIDGPATLYPDYHSFWDNLTPTIVHSVRIVGPYTMQQFEGQESA